MKLSNINIGGRYHIEKLIASVIIDFIGDATLVGMAVPVIGVITNTIWAPVSAILVWLLYGMEIPAGIALIEQGSGVASFFPTATLTWIYTTFVDKR